MSRYLSIPTFYGYLSTRFNVFIKNTPKYSIYRISRLHKALNNGPRQIDSSGFRIRHISIENTFSFFVLDSLAVLSVSKCLFLILNINYGSLRTFALILNINYGSLRTFALLFLNIHTRYLLYLLAIFLFLASARLRKRDLIN